MYRPRDMGLQACCAMSGTELAYGAISLCACYAMSGTEIAYGGQRKRAGKRKSGKRFHIHRRDVRY
eukprot:62864-Rhodomonas_salina.7